MPDLATATAIAPRPSKRPHRRFVASLGEIGRAPERFRVWRAGINRWDGELAGASPVNFTPRAAERVMAEYLRRGNPLRGDYEHAISLAERRGASPEELTDLPSCGYQELELVETPDGPELWCVPRWSDCGRDAPAPGGEVCCARHQIESGQRCEFSPDWLADETTGEPIKINRISLVGDGAMHGIGLLASVASVRSTMGEIDGCRAAYAYHARMAAAGGDDAKEHETMAAKLKASAAALGVDLEKSGEPDGDEPPKKPEAATAAEPPPAAPPEKKPEAATAAAPAMASAQVNQPLTLAQVLRTIDDRDALHRLLELNADRIPEKHRTMLASRGLAAAREYVEGLPPRPAPKGTEGDTGGPVPHASARTRPWRAPLSDPHHAYLASRIRSALGKTEKDEEEFDKRVDDDGGITVSLVTIAQEQAAARRGKAVAA